MLSRYFTVLILALAIISVRAQETDTVTSSVLSQPGTFYFYLGDFDAQVTEPELINPSAEFAIGVGAMFDYAANIDWGLDVLLVSRDYDTPDTISGGAFTVVSDDMDLNTLGLTLNVRFKFPTGPAVWYAGVGAGIYVTKLRLTGSTLGFIGTHEERSFDTGYAYYWGMAFSISNNNYLGIEYRILSLDASLEPVITAERDIGGESLLLSYAFRF